MAKTFERYFSRKLGLLRTLIVRGVLASVFWREIKFLAPRAGGSQAFRRSEAAQTFLSLGALLTKLAKSLGATGIKPLREISLTPAARARAEEFKTFANLFGTDKAHHHGYHLAYGRVLAGIGKPRNVLEFGVGSQNHSFPGHMSTECEVGASLRLFRELLPSAKIFGCDLDPTILFDEDRISCLQVDQANAQSMHELLNKTPPELDLIVDDGFHSTRANILSLNFAVQKIRKGGWYICEDISPRAERVWWVISLMMSARFKTELLKADSGPLIFLAQRI